MAQHTKIALKLIGIVTAVAAYLLGHPASAGDGSSTVERFADYWTGLFSNERQVRLNGDRLMPNYPELVRSDRDHRVYRLSESSLGEVVLFLEETKHSAPDIAHRQRVMTIDWVEASKEIRVNQLFFKTGPAYDRKLLNPETVAVMDADQFDHIARCDLFFTWNEDFQRFEGGMRKQECTYEHQVSGPVYAEFDMILDQYRMMYRDRSIKRTDGSIRGEIDGFSWLIFDRLSKEPTLANGDRISRQELMRRMPISGSMEGTWLGEFIRLDAEGKILEKFPTKIVASYLPDGHEYDFHQLNIYRPGAPDERTIESFGKWDIDRLHFFNDRLEGWSKDLDIDDSGLTSAFTMKFRDGSGVIVSEIISRSPNDPNKRMRATQYIKDGEVFRRTMIREVRLSN